MDIFRKLYDVKGGKIRLVVDDGEYEGILKHLYPDIGKISLAKVVPLPQRAPMFPMLHFFTREIRSYSVVSIPVEEKKIKSKKICAADLEAKLGAHQRHDIAKFLQQDAFESSSEDDETSRELMEELVNEKEYVLNVPEHLKTLLPLDNEVISNLNSSFHLAIKHVLKQDVIGVGFEGENIGRHGNLCWITISSSWCTFLFDIHALKQDAFEKGLRNILESSQILKVIHDSRQPSDALYHQYKTELKNVFDTQVGDVFADMQNSKPGTVGKYVRSLKHCLIQYLSLKQSDFPSQTVKFSRTKGCMSEWEYCPLPNVLRDRAIKNAIYLKLLRERVMERMLRSYYAAVDVYLSVVRGASTKELELEPSAPHMLPQALLSAGLQTFHVKRFPQQPTRSKAELGFVEADENPMQAYLNRVEKEEVLELMEHNKSRESDSDNQNIDPNLEKKDTIHYKLNGLKHPGHKVVPTVNNTTSEHSQEHVLKKLQECVRKCSISKSEDVNEESCMASSEEKPFQWPVVPIVERVPSTYAPAGISMNAPGRKNYR